MPHIKSPTEVVLPLRDKTLFLAGGITNCPDWQEATGIVLADDYAVFNPRRRFFDVDDPTVENDQIEWEHHYLHKADIILFWFPKETLCPITLFELGCFLNTPKTLIIGVEPGYLRSRDIDIQVGLARPKQRIWHSLLEMVADLL